MRRLRSLFFLIQVSALFLAPDWALAQLGGGSLPEAGMTSTEKPAAFEGVGIDEKLGAQLDLSTLVRTEAGDLVPLKSLFRSGQPVLLSLVYFASPGLCNFHLNGLTDGVKKLDWQVGDKFQIVSLSIDAKEGSELASKKKETYLKLLGRPQAAAGWHFVTADEKSIQTIADQVGFRFKWDEKNKDWAHASAAIVISPDGKISRYLHGIIFEPRDLKLAMLDSLNGKTGSIADKLVWYCFQYDSHKSTYSIMAFRLVQLGGGMMILLLVVTMLPFYLRTRKGNA